MNVMRTFTNKSMRQNKKRTIVTIIGVIISAAMITAVSTFVASFMGMLQRAEIAENGNWHARIQGISAQNLSIIQDSGDVDATVRSMDLGFAPLDGSKNEQKPYLFLRAYSPDGYERMSIRLLSGRLPQKAGEVVISETIRNSAGVEFQLGETLDLTIGRRMRIDAPDEQIDNNPDLQYAYDENGNEQGLNETFEQTGSGVFTIVGIMERPGFEYSWSAGCAVLGFLDESALSAGDTVDVYVTMNSVDRGIYDDVLALAKQAGTGTLTPRVAYNDNLLRTYGVVAGDNLYGFLLGFAAVIVIIIAVASVSLIYNAFAISVSERGKQLGLLSSVGATKKQKRTSVYHEALFVGAIGIPLGILFGIGGISVTFVAVRPLLDSFINVPAGVTLTPVVSPLAVVAAIVLSAVTIFISAYIPARRASKIMPIDAIRQTGDVKLTRRKVKTSRLTRKLFGFEAEIALKNLKRSRRRYRATIVSLVVSLVLFLTVSTYASMTQTLVGASTSGINFDIQITFSQADESQRADMNEQIAALEHVIGHTEEAGLYGSTVFTEDQLTERARALNTRNEDGTYELSVSLIGLDEDSFAAYAEAAGIQASAYQSMEKAVLINYGQGYFGEENDKKKTAGDILSLRPGDSVALRPGGMQGPGEPLDIEIGAVTDERPMGTLTQGLTGVTLVMPRAAFDEVTGSLGDEWQQSVQYTTYVTTDDDQALEQQLVTLGQTSPADIRLYNVQSSARNESNLAMFLGVFVYGFIILITLICIANIFNTVSTNIALRRREFAMLRSVGMAPKSFNRMIRFESVFYGLKALLYGLPISIGIACLLNHMEGSVLLSAFTLPWKSYAFAIAMILIIVFTTMLYSTNKIKKENIVDALKEESF